MEKDLELAARLRAILRELQSDPAYLATCNELLEIIEKLDPPSLFPAPVNGIEIRPVVNRFQTAFGSQFDIVKRVNENKCYSIGTLRWNEHEHWFDFTSIGTRLFEAAPSKEVCDMIVNFCNKMIKEYQRGNRDE